MIQRMFVTLDTKKTNYKNVGKINHGDDLILELTVLSDGNMISFNDPMVDLLVKKSDGKMIRQNSGIEHIKPNKFIIEVKKDCVTSPGLSTNQLIINDNGRISTCMFYYTILNSLEEDIIESISNVEVLEQLDEFTIQIKDKMENFDEELQNRMSELEDAIDDLVEFFGDTSVDLLEAELSRNEAEQSRAQAESVRVQNESRRLQNDLDLANAEAERVRAENIRIQNEADRALVDAVMDQKESGREDSELERIQNESKRATDELVRQQNENTRQYNESVRIYNENDRKTQENRRVTAETNRVNAETTRRNNENSRISNENERQKTIKEMKSLLDDARGFDDRVGVIEDEIEEINSSLDNIVNKTYEINVCNPPTETGLLPLLIGGDISENTKRLQDIFDYIIRTQKLYKEDDMSLYTGYTYKVKFPTGTFIFDKQIDVKGSFLVIEGQRTIIQTTHNNKTFMFSGDNGWNTEITGFTFDRVYDGIYTDFSNIEMGNFDIENCWFIDVKNEAIHIEKQSLIVNITYCKFHKCKYVLYVEHADRAYFEKNWISEKPREEDKDASIINKSMMYSNLNLFVPYKANEGVKESAYFNNYSTLISQGDHFGAEIGSKCIVNNFARGKNTVNSPYMTVQIKNSSNLYCNTDYTVLRLFEIPNKIDISDNLGLVDSTKLIEFGNDVDIESLTSWLNNSNSNFKLILSNNMGNIYSDNVRTKIPTQLHDYLVNNIANTHMNYKHEINKINELIYEINNIDINSSYIFHVSGNPSPSSSTLYKSSCVGIISFKCSFESSQIKLKPVLTMLSNNKGGFPEISEINISLLINDSDSLNSFTGQTVKLTINIANIQTSYLSFKNIFDGVLI